MATRLFKNGMASRCDFILLTEMNIEVLAQADCALRLGELLVILW